MTPLASIYTILLTTYMDDLLFLIFSLYIVLFLKVCVDDDDVSIGGGDVVVVLFHSQFSPGPIQNVALF